MEAALKVTRSVNLMDREGERGRLPSVAAYFHPHTNSTMRIPNQQLGTKESGERVILVTEMRKLYKIPRPPTPRQVFRILQKATPTLCNDQPVMEIFQISFRWLFQIIQLFVFQQGFICGELREHRSDPAHAVNLTVSFQLVPNLQDLLPLHL